VKKNTLIVALALGLTAISVPAVRAHDRYEHIQRDTSHIERDRAQLRADEIQLHRELNELYAARQHRRWASWHGWGWRAHQAQHQVQYESAEIIALRNKIARERADLARDVADARRDQAPQGQYGRRYYRDTY
jgi:hypothetical protein